ncbi:hypothetical protein DVH24_040549 [Malus domestica]|uniref:Uncharacterized protein n=1 Tax=Malus domestica TaxID=3750 RepID=A0A498IB61_MALDO|nr:hypothetical protein DVH24_040549 [Malus domestica]
MRVYKKWEGRKARSDEIGPSGFFVIGWDKTEWDRTGQDGTEREQRCPQMETRKKKKETKSYNFMFHGCGTSRSRGMRWKENSPKIFPWNNTFHPF